MQKFSFTKAFYNSIAEISIEEGHIEKVIQPVIRKFNILRLIYIILGGSHYREYKNDYPFYEIEEIRGYVKEMTWFIFGYNKYFQLCDIVGLDTCLTSKPEYRIYVSNNKELTVFHNDIVWVKFLDGSVKGYTFTNTHDSNHFYNEICAQCREAGNEPYELEGEMYKLNDYVVFKKQ